MYKSIVLFCVFNLAIAFPPSPMQETRIDLNGDWKIVGGSDAPIGAYPFMASIRSFFLNHFCGGTILNSQWILTAAHCLWDISPELTSVAVGTNYLSFAQINIPAKRFILHEGFSNVTYNHDIALIELSEPITFSDVVTPAVLNTGDVGAIQSTLIGWGRTYTGSLLPNNLQHLVLNTITNTDCKAVWGDYLLDGHLCTVGLSGYGTCHGDSGGPLVRSSDGQLIAVVSFGTDQGCALGYPDVYTRVSEYISWIDENIV